MKAFEYTLLDDADTQPAIGLVVLQSDETLEHELRQWLPTHCRLFHTRIPNSQNIDTQSLLAMQARLPDSVALLPSHTRFRVIAYGCTSASTVIGEQAVRDAIQQVFPDSAVTNPLTAIKARLRHLDARRIALLTPYEPQVSAALIRNLEADGFSVITAGSFNETEDHRVARISPDSLYAGVQALCRDEPVDAVVASCTNLRTHDLLHDASMPFDCPLVSSNSALAWHITALLER